jgi:hypothetical protein
LLRVRHRPSPAAAAAHPQPALDQISDLAARIEPDYLDAEKLYGTLHPTDEELRDKPGMADPNYPVNVRRSQLIDPLLKLNPNEQLSFGSMIAMLTREL